MEPNPHLWTELITFSVVPVVIISACGLLCLAFYGRLNAIVTRLRTIQRERLREYKEIFELEKENTEKSIKQEAEHFLHHLEKQTTDLLKRAFYIRNCIVCLILAIFSLVISSLFIGLSVVFPILDFSVVIFFVLGLFLVLSGLCFAIIEILKSLRPIQIESDFVQELLKSTLTRKGSK